MSLPTVANIKELEPFSPTPRAMPKSRGRTGGGGAKKVAGGAKKGAKKARVVKVQDTQMRCRSLLFEAVRQDIAGTVAPGVRANSLHVRNRSHLRRSGFPRLHVVVRVPTGVAVGVAAAPRNVNLQSALARADVSAPSYHLHWDVVVVVLLRMHA